MNVTIFGGSPDAIRDASAADAAAACARDVDAFVTQWDSEESAPLVDLDAQPDLFAAPVVLLATGALGPHADVIAQVAQNHNNTYLFWSAQQVPKALAKADEVQVVTFTAAKAPLAYLSGVGVSPAVRAALVRHVGKDTSRLPVIVAAARTQYGPDLSGVSVDDMLAVAGPASGPAPWDLTDALDRGDIPGALRTARALMRDPKSGPVGVVTIVAKHVHLLARVAASGSRNPDEVAALIGHTGSTFPLVKATKVVPRYTRALPTLVRLTEVAARDVRGGRALDPGVVVDVLVARVAATARA